MVTDVALVGELVSRAQQKLEENVTEPVRFHPITDPADENEVQSAFDRAHVVVGEWPDDASGPDVRLVQHIGAGVDGYEREALPDEAYLCNVYGHADGVAEHVFTLLLALRRHLLKLDAELRQGRWPDPDVSGAVRELGGLTMGIIGFGRIGRALVDKANAFGLDVLAVRSQEPEGSPPPGVESVVGPDELDWMLRESDVVVLGLPLTEETEGLIGPRELDAIGPDGYLINVARGPVVDEQALYEALEEDRIAGAGLDTWYRYPEGSDEQCRPSNAPFHELDNVVMTPHVAGWTEATADHRWQFIAENIDRIARGETPKNVVWKPQTEP